jgi:hypothetical protein
LILVNKGNSLTHFLLEGRDDEEACNYEFKLPDSPAKLTGEVPVCVPRQEAGRSQSPGYRAIIPVKVSPRPRPPFLHRRTYPFTVSVTPLEGEQTPQLLEGHLIQRPFLNPIVLLLLGLLFLCLCGSLAFWPPTYIWRFTVDDQVSPVITEAGKELPVSWWISPLVAISKIEPIIDDSNFSPGGQHIVRELSGDLVVTPESYVSGYQLEAESFLSFLIPDLKATRVVKVLVTPTKPSIKFNTDRRDVIAGEQASLSWEVQHADSLLLLVDGTPEPIPTEAYQATRVIVPQQDAIFALEARNAGGVISNEILVAVVVPTPTPIPTAAIEQFNFSSNQLTAGEELKLDYSISGGEKVFIEPIGGGVELPPDGSLSLSPQESTQYTLITENTEGTRTVLATQQVVVDAATSTPTPTATPAPPVIVEFNASKFDFILSENNDDDDDDDGDNIVTLFWTVEGQVTDIQLANGQGTLLHSGLPPVSQIDQLVTEDNDSFTLIALNGPQSSRRSLALQVKALNKPTIFFFKAEIDPGNSFSFPEGATSNTCSTAPEHHEERLKCITTTNISSTATIALSWEVEGATSITLDPLGSQGLMGNLELEGTAEILGNNDGDNTNNKRAYTLTAKNEAGETVRKLMICDFDVGRANCKQ